MLSEDDVASMLINPFYAISIDPDLVGLHEAMVSKEQWVDANKRLVEEIGLDAWLRRLLEVLEGDYPRNPNDPTIVDGYH